MPIPRSLIPLLLLAAPAAAPAAPKPAASAYTKVDLDRCTEIEHEDEGSWARWKCSGYARIPLWVEVGDERFDVDAGDRPDDEGRFGNTFDSPPSTVEWRHFAGRPFAIIYRLTTANPDVPTTSVLVVETIGRGKATGCRVAEIPGSAKNANSQARAIADAIPAGRKKCLGSR